MPSGKGALSGAAAGAGAGSMFGPWGAGIGAGIGGLLGLFGGGGNKPMSPELERMFQVEQNRFEQSNPLVEAAYRLAFSRLPTAARAGIGEPSLASAAQGLPPLVGGGDYNEPYAVRNALRSQEVRMRMADPIIQAVQRLAMSRMPRAFIPGTTPIGGQGGRARDDMPGGSKDDQRRV